jgi:hypothetical protein
MLKKKLPDQVVGALLLNSSCDALPAPNNKARGMTAILIH